MVADRTSGDLCPNWVFSNNSNVQDLGWFEEYTQFESTAGSLFGGQMPVAGIGTVRIPVKKSPHRSGKQNHGELVLHDVLHCPSSLCNIIGYPPNFEQKYSVTLGSHTNGSSSGTIKDSHGANVAYFDGRQELYQVKLSGPPVGPAVGPNTVKKGGLYMLNVRWAQIERHRWEAHKKAHKHNGDTTNTSVEETSGYNSGILKTDQLDSARNAARSSGPYTDLEKKWLKQHYGGEYKFLRSYGWKIYKETHREKGRDLVRTLMADGASNMDTSPQQEMDFEEMSEDTEEGFEDDLEEDLQGHMTDHLFNERGLIWIEKHYGNSMNFMYSHGLKFYDTEDCQEAKDILAALIEEN